MNIRPPLYHQELETAKQLCKPHEADLPLSVDSIIRFCADKQVGFILSRNDKSLSCVDARNKRSRLGHIGIPLYDELKSNVFLGTDGIVIMAHCRGHKMIDVELLEIACGYKKNLEKMPEDEMQKRFGMVYGTVNPFLAQAKWASEIIHVLDEGLFTPIRSYPATMMTNAGDFTWGIEFDPITLPKILSPVVITNIATANEKFEAKGLDCMTTPKSIGIITGNGPDSGIILWQKINKYFVKILGVHFKGDISLPKVNIASVPAIGLSMELKKRDDATWKALREAVLQLKSQGTDILALACHTTHYYTDKIRELFEGEGRKFTSMAEEAINYISYKQINDIAILGVSYVADLGIYSAYTELNTLNIENISPHILQKFHAWGYEVKKIRNVHTPLQGIKSVLKDLESDNVLIALTELSVLYESQKVAWDSIKNIIDPIDIYAKAIANESLGK